MSSMSSRLKVLNIYKKLHRTSKKVFNGDVEALAAARLKINEEFRKHVTVQEPEKIDELITVANDAEVYLRKEVIQLQQTEPNVYKARIREDNIRENPKTPPPPQRERRRKKSEDTTS